MENQYLTKYEILPLSCNNSKSERRWGDEDGTVMKRNHKLKKEDKLNNHHSLIVSCYL